MDLGCGGKEMEWESFMIYVSQKNLFWLLWYAGGFKEN